MVEKRLHSQNTELRIALRRIRQDRELYPASFGMNGNQSTKLKTLENLFGHKARHGETRTYGGKEVHVPGYYDRYPELSVSQINDILVENVIKLANATILMHQERFIKKDLDKAQTAAKFHRQMISASE